MPRKTSSARWCSSGHMMCRAARCADRRCADDAPPKLTPPPTIIASYIITTATLFFVYRAWKGWERTSLARVGAGISAATRKGK